MSIEPPADGVDVRSTHTFRLLRGGRERKLGRPLDEAELLELEGHATRSLQAGVRPAPQRPAIEAARAVVAALPKVLEGLDTTTPRPNPKLRRLRRRAPSARMRAEAIAEASERVREAIRDGRLRAGPNLPAFARKTSAIYVQQDDLEDIIPDGWGRRFPAQASRVARQHGLPPLALPLLCILEWASSIRPPLPFAKDRHECGAGLQVSLDWLARKLGCSRVWVQALMNRLDPFARWRRECGKTKRANRKRAKHGQSALPSPPKPTGTAFLHRFRRLRRYADTCDDAARRQVWVDAQGKPHTYVDVRGVCYATSAGRAVIGRHGRSARDDAHRRGHRLRWRLAARLRRGHAIVGGDHAAEVLENRREIAAAPALPEDLSPKHPLPKDKLKS